MHNTRWYKTVLGETHTIPGGMNISFGRSSGEGGILGAWCYTRQVGQRRSLRRAVQLPGIPRRTAAKGSSSPGVIPGGMGQRRSKQRTVQFQGVPGGVACGSIPGKAATFQSKPVGSRWRWCDLQSVVYTRVAWEMAITKSNLVFVYNRSLPDSVYTRSFPRFCLYQVISKILFIPGHC